LRDEIPNPQELDTAGRLKQTVYFAEDSVLVKVYDYSRGERELMFAFSLEGNSIGNSQIALMSLEELIGSDITSDCLIYHAQKIKYLIWSESVYPSPNGVTQWNNSAGTGSWSWSTTVLDTFDIGLTNYASDNNASKISTAAQLSPAVFIVKRGSYNFDGSFFEIDWQNTKIIVESGVSFHSYSAAWTVHAEADIGSRLNGVQWRFAALQSNVRLSMCDIIHRDSRIDTLIADENRTGLSFSANRLVFDDSNLPSGTGVRISFGIGYIGEIAEKSNNTVKCEGNATIGNASDVSLEDLETASRVQDRLVLYGKGFARNWTLDRNYEFQAREAILSCNLTSEHYTASFNQLRVEGGEIRCRIRTKNSEPLNGSHFSTSQPTSSAAYNTHNDYVDSLPAGSMARSFRLSKAVSGIIYRNCRIAGNIELDDKGYAFENCEFAGTLTLNGWEAIISNETEMREEQKFDNCIFNNLHFNGTSAALYKTVYNVRITGGNVTGNIGGNGNTAQINCGIVRVRGLRNNGNIYSTKINSAFLGYRNSGSGTVRAFLAYYRQLGNLRASPRAHLFTVGDNASITGTIATESALATALGWVTRYLRGPTPLYDAFEGYLHTSQNVPTNPDDSTWIYASIQTVTDG
jgi:hypothetical protein